MSAGKGVRVLPLNIVPGGNARFGVRLRDFPPQWTIQFQDKLMPATATIIYLPNGETYVKEEPVEKKAAEEAAEEAVKQESAQAEPGDVPAFVPAPAQVMPEELMGDVQQADANAQPESAAVPVLPAGLVAKEGLYKRESAVRDVANIYGDFPEYQIKYDAIGLAVEELRAATAVMRTAEEASAVLELAKTISESLIPRITERMGVVLSYREALLGRETDERAFFERASNDASATPEDRAVASQAMSALDFVLGHEKDYGASILNMHKAAVAQIEASETTAKKLLEEPAAASGVILVDGVCPVFAAASPQLITCIEELLKRRRYLRGYPAVQRAWSLWATQQTLAYACAAENAERSASLPANEVLLIRNARMVK